MCGGYTDNQLCADSAELLMPLDRQARKILATSPETFLQVAPSLFSVPIPQTPFRLLAHVKLGQNELKNNGKCAALSLPSGLLARNCRRAGADVDPSLASFRLASISLIRQHPIISLLSKAKGEENLKKKKKRNEKRRERKRKEENRKWKQGRISCPTPKEQLFSS
ncbi:hypothetical protein V6Z79_007107 [Aspergillus fumigatus]